MCALNQSLNVQYLFDIPVVTEVVWVGICDLLLKNYKANPNKIWFVASVGQGDKKCTFHDPLIPRGDNFWNKSVKLMYFF